MGGNISDISIEKSIVFIGLMGSGKSAIGRRLAARLGLKFVDADAEIETAAGCSIEDIFEVHGEAAFRDGERRVIARLLAEPPHVLATGGGAFMDPETRARIRNDCISIWLRASCDVLLARVSRRKNRPLLKRGNKREIIQALIDERYPVYAEADITVESVDGPHEQMVETVFGELTRFFAAGQPAGGSDQATDAETPTETPPAADPASGTS